MHIGVIGGGTAGLACAWMLDDAHRVTVLEAQPILGGHVRTLGGNVHAPGVDIRLDAGVVLLEKHRFPNVHRLMDCVGAERRPVDAPVSMTARPGHTIITPALIPEQPLRERPGYYLRGAPAVVQRARFVRRVRRASLDALYARPLSAYLPGDPTGTWLRLLMMYAYSTPWDDTADLPAALTAPILEALAFGGEWSGFVGGAWAWLERLLATMGAEVRTGAAVEAVTRDPDGVDVRVDGTTQRFDAVVFATPPGEILPLLTDADDGERRRLGAWRSRPVQTVLHTDEGPYQRRKVTVRTPFDMLKTDRGWAYTAALNPMAGLPDGPPTYQLAFDLEHELDPSTIVHVQDHLTPWYTVEALKTRREVRAWQGHRHTWIAGAWLGEGLQEGAVTSAMQVAQRLGGRLP